MLSLILMNFDSGNLIQLLGFSLDSEFADTRLETEAALRAASVYGVMAKNIYQAQNISDEAINATEYASDLASTGIICIDEV